MLVNKATDEW
jgi:hypothetical protein